MEDTSQVLMNYLVQLPIILAGLAGIILAIALWGRNRTASVLVLIGCAIAVVMSITSPMIYYWVNRRLAQGDLRVADLGTFFRIVGLIHTTVFAGALGLLIPAAFVGRRKAVPMATAVG